MRRVKPRHKPVQKKTVITRTLSKNAPVQVDTNLSRLQPGLLVSLKTTLMGNVKYSSVEIEEDHLDDDGARRASWETTRIVTDPKEHEAAVVVRSKARSLVTSVCAFSAFGLLCPENRSEQLTAAMTEARQVVAEFNAKAKHTQVGVYAIVGRVAPDDVEAVRAISSEVRELLTAMETGLKRLDVKAVREAANKARSLSSVLSADAGSRVQKAIEVARSAARQIVKAGETGAAEIDIQTLRTIRRSRTAFLDMDNAQETKTPRAAGGRAVDLLPAAAVATPKSQVRRSTIEL